MVNLPKYISLFVRFDDLYSRNSKNSAKDESSAILGAQFKIGKYVKIAPNFKMILLKTNETENIYTAYLNCQVGF